MKILFVCPPCSAFTPIESSIPPLGLARVAAVVKKKSTVRVMDMACNEALGFDSWAELITILLEFQPNVVGIGPLVTSNIKKGEEVAKLVKSYLPIAKIVLGGPDPTFTYHKLLDSNSSIDVVFIGEAEKSFSLFIDVYNSPQKWEHIKGIAYRKEGGIVSTGHVTLTGEEFKGLPFPAWELFPIEGYSKIARKAGFEPYLPIESSRGCPLNCIFCACTNIFENKVKYRTPSSIVEEIKQNIDHYGYKRFVFNDDNAGNKIKHMSDIADAIINSGIQGIKLAFSSTVESIIFSNETILLKLKDAGFDEIFMGCETPHPETIKIVRKTENPEMWPYNITKSVESCRKVGIASRTNWILGLPSDTKEKFIATIKFIKELKPDSALISLLQPYPGTPLEVMMRNNPDKLGVYQITDNPSDMVASKFEPVLFTKWMSKDEMIEMAFKFLRNLSPYLEANISGSPYYIFELWREKNI